MKAIFTIYYRSPAVGDVDCNTNAPVEKKGIVSVSKSVASCHTEVEMVRCVVLFVTILVFAAAGSSCCEVWDQ